MEQGVVGGAGGEVVAGDGLHEDTDAALDRLVGEPAEVERVQVRSNVDETKASLMTTEFWAMLAVIAAILIAASRLDQFTGQ